MKSIRPVTDQVDAQELAVIQRELKRILTHGVIGDVVELGCYEGGSAVFMQTLLDEHSSDKKLWLYDSFEGLPEKTAEDMSALGGEFQAGALKASRSRLLRNFHKAGLRMPEVTKAWFYELTPEDMPETISFAFLDGDFYESIADSLRLVWPRLAAGAVVIVDDYENPKLRGVRRAVDEWVAKTGAQLRTEKSLAILNG